MTLIMMGDGKYDPEYERLCYRYKYLFTEIDISLGASWRMPDWFVNSKQENTMVHYEIPFLIPSLEQLNVMLTERIRLCQKKDEPEEILLVFASEMPGWILEVQLGNHAFHGSGNSPHTAYVRCIQQMSAHVSQALHTDKRPDSFQAKRKQKLISFTSEYIDICRSRRNFFRARRKSPGEWYGNVRTGEVIQHGKDPLGGCDSEWFYIPEVDELFAFLTNQIMLTQESVKPAEMVALNYKRASGWEVMIKLENGIAHKSGGGKSQHEVLFKALLGMAAFDVKLRNTEVPRISVNPQRFREFAWHMELEVNPDLCNNPASSKPVINNVVSKEGQFPDKSKGILIKLMVAFRKIRRIRFGKW